MSVLSGHQPAYLPWLPYLHKLFVSDVFIFMDEVKFIRRDFIHRNKICNQGKELSLTIPIHNGKKAEHSKILEISSANNGEPPTSKTHWQYKHFHTFRHAYRQAPYFSKFISFIEDMYLENTWHTISDLCWYQLCYLVENTDILKDKKIVRMSEISNSGAKDELVLNHAKLFGCDKVFFGKMGENYVRKEIFKSQDVLVAFQKFDFLKYNQLSSNFLPRLSVFDCLMNCSFDGLTEQILNQPIPKEEIHFE